MADKENKKTRERQEDIRERIEDLKDFIMEHRRIVLPVVLAAALIITVIIGVSANKKKENPEEVQANAGAETGTAAEANGISVPDVPLEQNAYPEVNELIMRYYKAMESGETSDLPEIVSPLTDSYLIRFTELATHVEACPVVDVYTKPGPAEDSYIAYVCTEIQMVGYSEKTVPGIMSFYICKNSAGNYYINIEEEIDQEIADYIMAIDLQDDVVDLNNKVTAAFNNLVAEDEAAADYYVKVTQSITKGIQEKMAALNEPEEEEQTDQPEETATAVTTKKIVKATAVVNMRSSDSEVADKLGKAQIGDKFTVLEERVNGWTKVTDGSKEFFIKSDYLEVVSEEPIEGGNTAAAEPQTPPPAANASLGSSGYVTAKTTVNVRASASENGEKLGKLQRGEKVECIMNQADGWCKVKYKGKTAYVKSEYLE